MAGKRTESIASRESIDHSARMKALWRMMALTVLGILTGPLMAEEAVKTEKGLGKSVKPGINAKFVDPDLNVDAWLKRFEVESREVFQQRKQVVATCGI